MTKLLNLTIKINDKDKYDIVTPGVVAPNSDFRLMEISSLEIKDQDGTIISELKNSGGGLGAARISVNDIKNIRLNFPVLDIPISWAWEKKTTAEIEFTLKKLKYDETRGLSFSRVSSTTTGTATNTLFLTQDNFEGFEVFKNKEGKQYSYLSQIIELSNNFSNDVKQTLRDFLDLRWKIMKAEEDEQITRFIPELESYLSATSPSLKHDFYQLKKINGGAEEVKNICQEILKEIKNDLTEWKKVGIKTLVEVQEATKNGFDIITNPGLKTQIGSDGKYQGFFIASPETHEIIVTRIDLFSGFTNKEKVTEKRYTKSNIDKFRQFFTNDLDQSDPKYFKGFQPGDIQKNFAGDFVSINHKADIESQTNSEWKFERSTHTRVYYEFKSYYDGPGAKPYDILLVILKNKFAEIPNKTKKEHLDIYWGWIREHWPKAAKEDKNLKGYYRSLSELLPLLETSYINETKDNCENALKILKNYENLRFDFFSAKYQVWLHLEQEIEAKKTEVTDRLKFLFDQAIGRAVNEDYGSGSLSSERKRIFTTYRSQIENWPLLTEIKELIKLLFKGEKIIPSVNNLEKMALVNKLKEEYQNGKGDKKTAYSLVNQVDNQWADRIITELGKFTKKDLVAFLAERRTQLLTKYENSAMTQTVFGNKILDSVGALEEADKLLTKVREAETKNDTDTSLLKFLQNYQKAQEGTLKNKAWQAVNSYNQQAEAAIKHLQKNYQSREELAKAIQDAKNESKLEAAYNQAQNSELYQQGDKSKTVIDNLVQRKKVLFQIEPRTDISAPVKTLLQIILVKLIPDTIKDDDDEQELTWLEDQLKSFKTVSEGEEKGKIYQEYKEVIDQVLTEISQEKQRYQQTKQQDNEEVGGQTKTPPSGLPKWAWVLIIVGVITAVGSIILIVSRNSRKRIKKSIKLK